MTLSTGISCKGTSTPFGKVVRIDDLGSGRRLWIRPPDRFIRKIVAKGSIAIDGVSLTVAEIVKDRFSVVLIPSTLADATLAGLTMGERVNIESDVVGRLAAERLLARRRSWIGWRFR